MPSTTKLFRKLSLLFTRDRFRSELDEEMAFHRAQAELEFAASGMSREASQKAAARQFGNSTLLKERSHEVIGFRFETVAQDVRYALRQIQRKPGFTLILLLTLSLGIGACTAVFSLVNAVLLRSLPYGDPERLVYLFTPSTQIPIAPEIISPSYADFYDLKQQSHSFASMTNFEQATFHLASQGATGQHAERIGAARVDDSFFTTLDSAPELGRAIGADDNQPGHDKVAMISHSLWQSMFASKADVLQHSLILDGSSYRIIGVMQPGFEYPLSSDLPYGNHLIKKTRIWVPLALTAKQKANREPDSNVTIARLRTSVSIREAQAEMSTIMTRLDKLHTGELRGWGAFIKSFMDTAIGPVRGLMWLLLGAVSIVLLISCGNAANLLLARAASRVQELGLRVALGADRVRVIRQLLTESLLIGLVAGVIGVSLAWLFLRLLPHLNPGNIPRLNEASLDMRVMIFTVIVSVLTSVLTGILPALSVSKVNLAGFLATGNSRGIAGRHSRSQSILIIAEVALVVVLLAGAGLLIRSYINVESLDTGFSQSTVTMSIELDPHYRQPQAGRAAVFKNLMSKIEALPGVSAAGAVSDLPLNNSESLGFFWVDGFANRKDQLTEGRSITPQYFSAMGIPLIAGRSFTEEDASSPTRPTIINQQFAKSYFANRNPIGGRISTDDAHAQWDTVVGVVADVRHSSLEAVPQPQMYRAGYDFGNASIAVRTALPPSTVAAEIRNAVKSIDPNLTVDDIRTMGDLVSEASARRRFQTSLLAVFAAIALLLALVGLYGLMAYTVSSRTREVGIRMALGAQRTDVVLLVLKNAAWLIGFGMIGGLVCTWAATRTLKSFLFGLSEHDPLTILTVCVVLAVTGFLAAFLPARRAASVNPVEALRAE
jgi:predicted permease